MKYKPIKPKEPIEPSQFVKSIVTISSISISDGMLKVADIPLETQCLEISAYHDDDYYSRDIEINFSKYETIKDPYYVDNMKRFFNAIKVYNKNLIKYNEKLEIWNSEAKLREEQHFKEKLKQLTSKRKSLEYLNKEITDLQNEINVLEKKVMDD